MKKLFAAILAVTMVLSFSISTVFADSSTDPVKAITSSIVSDTSIDNALQNSESQDDVIKSKDLKAFKTNFSAEIASLNALRATCDANWNQIKSLNASIKAAWTTHKAKLAVLNKKDAKAIATALKANLTPVRTDVKNIQSAIKTIREQKKAEWVAFRAAVKAKDLTAAKTAINNILTLKQQIIDKQVLLIADKQQIIALINAAV